ncbi:lipoyl(octanoyl) transferase LipB [Paenibacillus apiarius]|uniref:Octanoyltransferase n=1 Tax=Paenibacillus apiarius TaxID=46240 RepID=A0ABT4DTB0_9BACL|nr:lipoyl(octanoyl) transferase LipB [Paenibacillus apiarius]MCY9517164.1 lipoyl(octanoyl) transferase LipB [Paenibacillus apiarius]MCY9519241.1 lipoyl(octanoyl) transferase LipB [Paenibacillus apiarius]MCY9555169.1 lipoyl(octanoyl) transferase LipB [Paenibacillus apiarius]MCY9559963.1 lipoyl(octanoyl) transferase LipB [Paenibacillus apiarius]MCY9683394.1 lipoyl(octanoyl) transferase LipB [Paenibacillus apiarius]
MNPNNVMLNSGKTINIHYLDRIDYGAAWDKQKEIVRAIDEGSEQDSLLLLEHPPTYTIGSQRHPEHLLLSPEQLKQKGIAVYEIDRGGDITYHGPGQLVGYPLLLLEGPQLDLHGYLRSLEEALIQFLGTFGIEGSRKPEYTGVWVGDLKIAAIGVKFNRCRHRRGFVTSHGFALNVKSGIEHEGFSGIIPCGISEYGVTSLEDCTGQTFSVNQVAQMVLPHVTQVLGFERANIKTKLQ